MKTKIWIATGFVSLMGCGKTISNVKEAWDRSNDPLHLGEQYEYTLAQLPVDGQATETPWSDSYWPSHKGGIALRWLDSEESDAFKYVSPDKTQVQAMSQEDLAKLSPAEKFDIFNDRYDYPTVKKERKRVSPDAESWEGICHGWAPAAINFAEPKPVLITNASGMQIPFGSADVKALLDYYQGVVSFARFHMLGQRCDANITDDPEAAKKPECRDTNAGAFHVILANLIGLQKKALVADVTRDAEVWNQPVYAFSTKLGEKHAPSAGASPDAVSEVEVETDMTYTKEVSPNWEALNGTDEFNNHTLTYRYRIELNSDGKIVGGAWDDDEDRPDFLWTQEKPRFDGYYSGLDTIYGESIKETPIVNPVHPANK